MYGKNHNDNHRNFKTAEVSHSAEIMALKKRMADLETRARKEAKAKEKAEEKAQERRANDEKRAVCSRKIHTLYTVFKDGNSKTFLLLVP